MTWRQWRARPKGLARLQNPPFDQADTYFNVQTGRLKLRQQDSAGDELIFYRRADENSPTEPRRYDRIPIVPAHRLGSILAQALGIKTGGAQAPGVVASGQRPHPFQTRWKGWDRSSSWRSR